MDTLRQSVMMYAWVQASAGRNLSDRLHMHVGDFMQSCVICLLSCLVWPCRGRRFFCTEVHVWTWHGVVGIACVALFLAVVLSLHFWRLFLLVPGSCRANPLRKETNLYFVRVTPMLSE